MEVMAGKLGTVNPHVVGRADALSLPLETYAVA
jgi:hypothetical protein